MLLPDPSKFKSPNKVDENYQKHTVFFAHTDLDELAKHFIGNIHRFYKEAF